MSDDYRALVNRSIADPMVRGCTSKIPFSSRKEARSVINRPGRHHKPIDGGLKPYRCRYADHWHLGHAR